MDGILQTIIGGLIVVVIGLLFEYKTGWFQARQSPVNIRPRIRALARKYSNQLRIFTPKLLRSFREFVNEHSRPLWILWDLLLTVLKLSKIVLEIIFVLCLIGISLFFLTPEARIHLGFSGILLLLFGIFGLMVGMFSKRYRVLVILCIADVFAVVVLLFDGHLFFGAGQALTLPISLSIPDFQDAKTMALFAVTLTLAAIWAIWVIAWRFAKQALGKIQDDLAMLYDAPDIARIIRETEKSLLVTVQSRWKEFQTYFAKRRHFITVSFGGDETIFNILNYVPIGIKKNKITLGLTSRRLRSIRLASGRSYDRVVVRHPNISDEWTFQHEIEKRMRLFFNKPYLQVACKLVSSDIFEQASKILELPEQDSLTNEKQIKADNDDQ